MKNTDSNQVMIVFYSRTAEPLTGSFKADVPDEKGGVQEVIFTAQGYTEETQDDYKWPDKEVAWVGKRSDFHMTGQCMEGQWEKDEHRKHFRKPLLNRGIKPNPRSR